MMNAPANSGGRRLSRSDRRPTAVRAVLLLLGLSILLAPLGNPAAGADGDPVAKGYRVVQPAGPLANGQVLEFYTYWDRADYRVEVDLSRLDNSALSPVLASYVGDTAIVVGEVTTDVWSRYWFQAVIDSANTRSDASGINVPVTAIRTSPADSTTLYALNFCLLNHPPAHVTSTFVGSRFVEHAGRQVYTARNGDSLRIETTWSFATRPFELAADFSALDAQFDPDAVFYWLSGPNTQPETYSIHYRLSDTAHGATTELLPVRIDVTDGACGAATTTLDLLIDNEGPAGGPQFLVLPDTVTARELAVAGYAPGGSHDVLILLNQHTEFVFSADTLGAELKFEGTITLEPGRNYLTAYGRDVVGNRSAAAATDTVTLMDAPEFKGFQVFLPDSTTLARGQLSLRDGDTVWIRTFWDSRAPYEVTADFTRVDSNGDPAVRATRCADVDTVVTVGGAPETWCCYMIRAVLSTDNALVDDSGLAVPITAVDTTTGFSVTTSVVQFCLYNDVLEHRQTMVIGDPDRYIEHGGIPCYRVRNGDPITLHTTWATRNRPMAILPDFLQLDQFYTINDVDFRLVEEESSDSLVTYEINYRLNRTAWGSEDPRPKFPVPVQIEGRDAACGVRFTTIYFEMDLAGPAGAPVLSAPLPEHVVTAALPIAGTAPEEAVDVVVEVEHIEADSTSYTVMGLGAGRAFSGSITLLPGENEITVYARDLLGNRSGPSARSTVSLVTAASVSIPRPFRPGDSFVFDTLAGWSRAEVEIYNLEGDPVRSWSAEGGSGVMHEVNIPWDGRNEAGESVRQGPFLLRYRMLDGAGRTALEEVKAFVLQK